MGIEIDGNINVNTTQYLESLKDPKPVTPRPPFLAQPTEPPVSPFNFFDPSDLLRLQVENDFDATQETIDPVVADAAEEVQTVFDSPPERISAHEAAAEKLVEVTADQPPNVVAAIITQSQPTIDLITEDLALSASREDGDHNNYQTEFDDTVAYLGIVSERALASPNGDEAVALIASSFVENIDPGGIGRFDEAFGRAVQHGTGSELTAEVITQLNAAGRTSQADDMLQNVEQAINNIRNNVSDAVEDAGRYDEELGWLIASWEPQMTEDQLNNAIEGYIAEHPEYQEAKDRIDSWTVRALRVTTAFQDPEINFSGLGHADNVNGALENLAGNENFQYAFARSQGATEELAALVERAETNPSAKSALDGLIKAAGSADDADIFGEMAFNKLFDVTIDRSLGAATAYNVDAQTGQLRADHLKRADNVTLELGKLERWADQLGYSSPQLSRVFNRLEDITSATTEHQVKIEMRRLRTDISVLRQTDPVHFGNNSRFLSKIEGFGILLSAAGAASSAYGAYTDGDALSLANALVDGGEFGADVVQLRMVQNLIQKRPLLSRIPVGAAGRALGGVGLLLDTYSIVNDLHNGDYAGAGINLVGAGGGALLIFGTTAAATGVGLVLIGGAMLAGYLYGRVEASNIHETDGARAFLEAAGIDPDLANELINNDSRGLSAAPVFTELASRLGVEPNEIFEYFQTLSPREAKTLIEITHGVDPNDEGVFADSIVDSWEWSNPNDVNDLIEWMRVNGYETAPGL